MKWCHLELRAPQSPPSHRLDIWMCIDTGYLNTYALFIQSAYLTIIAQTISLYKHKQLPEVAFVSVPYQLTSEPHDRQEIRDCLLRQESIELHNFNCKMNSCHDTSHKNVAYDPSSDTVSRGQEMIDHCESVHAFKLAFVHDEIFHVFQMRARMERHGVPSFSQNAFRRKSIPMTEADLFSRLQSVKSSINLY